MLFSTLIHSSLVGLLHFSTCYARKEPGQKSGYGSQPSCCQYLERSLGSMVSYPNSTVYAASLDSYWSDLEAEIKPNCVVLPTCSKDVSRAVRLLSKRSECKFAVRGGGHTPWAGAANIQDGVTIDLSALNDISLSSDRSIATVGGGAKLGQVYRYLDPMNLGVVGGRVSDVGIAGVTLGGGISFFSARYGFVCDTIDSFELVMADGHIENISASNKPDLFRALKGGSNNFGIVTHFNMRTFKSGDIWGGAVLNDISSAPQQAVAFEKLTGDPNYDPYAALIHSYVWTAEQPGGFILNQFAYTKVPATNSSPPAFADFDAIPSSYSTTTVQPLHSLTDQISPATNFTRQLFITLSYRNNADFYTSVLSLYRQRIQTLLPRIPQISLTFQPLPQLITSKSNNTNVLGFSPSDGNVVNVLGAAAWTDPSLDEIVFNLYKDLFEQGQQMAKKKGVFVRALYLNYAAKWQDPIGGYGEEEVEFLRRVSRKYDPRGVWQTQMPGGFKLWTGLGTG